MEIKRFKVFIGILSIVLCMTVFSGCSYAIGRFEQLNFVQEDNNMPVKLNDNEIFFPGGWDGNNTRKIIPAKVYNIKTNKLISLNTTMNFPRTEYGAIKYDDNHILVLGGSCIGENEYAYKDCSKVAEVYDIKNMKFSRIKDAFFGFNSNGEMFKQNNDFILFVNGLGIQKFNIKNDKFEKLIKFSPTGNIRSLKLDDDILMWGTYNVSDDFSIPRKTIDRVNLYSIKNNTIKKLQLDILTIYKTGIKLDNNNVLFMSGNKQIGNLSLYNNKNNELKEFGSVKFGTIGSSGLYLGDGNILLAGGCIDSSDYFAGKYLVRGIFNLKNKKFTQAKIVNKALYKSYIVLLNEHFIFISGYKYISPMIYKY